MKLIQIGCFVMLLSGVISLQAQQAEKRGLEIAEMADQADQGFESSEVELKMVLKNKQGQTSERSLSTNTLEMQTDGDRSLIVFHTPRDVKGTATLTYTHKTTSDDQWLYLPAVKRVKRISSDNKSGPFVGSEFAYEDLSSQEVEKYTYTFIKEEEVEGEPCFLVERIPVDPKSGYARQLVWYHQSAEKGHRLEKIEFYDRKNALLKTLDYNNYQQYLDKYWRAGEMHMVNHQTNKETILTFENYQFKTGISENDFTQNSLQRAGR